MSNYSLIITKGKIQISVSSCDKDFVSFQLEKWIQESSAYVKRMKSQEGRQRVAAQIDSELINSERKIDEQLKRIPKPQMIESPRETQIEEKNENIDNSNSQNTEKETIQDKIEASADFDSILDKSMKTPQEELSFKPTPAIKKDNAFLNYMGGRKNCKNIDYILLTAYYFAQYEQKPRFTIKQLNAKLMQNLAVIIDHSVLQEAINRGYIECLPDLTGIVGASEYRLTSYGEKTLLEG